MSQFRSMKSELFLCFLFLFGLIAAEDCDQDPADDPTSIDRPCPDFNVDCIRNYISNNAECEIAEGPMPDTIVYEHYTMQMPHCNLTIEVYDVIIKGLNGNITEFYVNWKTDKTVLVVETPRLQFESPRVTYKYNRKAKEPIERTDFFECYYGQVTFTIVFPSACNLELSKAEVFAYVDDSSLIYALGPGLCSNLDAATEKYFQQLISTIPHDLSAVFITQGKLFMNNYIQTNLCNFSTIDCK